MKAYLNKNLPRAAWAVSELAIALAFIAWGQGFGWHFDRLSLYVIFPLFGLVAFSTMWSQYAAGWLQQWLGADGKRLKSYFSATGFVVLVTILIHPGLLSVQLWRDGFGLPPGSEIGYVMPSLQAAVVVGMTSLLVFLAYELRRVFSTKDWWRFMGYAVDAAMLAILYHSLSLGDQLQGGWFKIVWWFYGLTLILFLGYKYWHKLISGKNGGRA